MTTSVLGEEGFRWFFGKVEDRNDPKKIGRVRVRIYNVHPFTPSGEPDTIHVPTDHLPWASPINTILSAGIISDKIKDGVGISPLGLLEGSTVFGFFADGNECQIPVILGSLSGLSGAFEEPDLPETSIEKNAVGALKSRKRIRRAGSFPGEPASPFAAKYPYNKSMRTESGHLIEIDDTPNQERLHIFHKSGSYLEVNSAGDIVYKSEKDSYNITTKNNNVYTGGNVNIFVQGNVTTRVQGSYTLDVDGDVSINGKTINLNRGVNGAARLNDSTSDNDSEINGADTGVITSSSRTVLIGD